MITKQQLLQALSVLPDDTKCSIEFNSGGRYSCKYDGRISGVTFMVNDDGKFTGIIDVQEVSDEEKDIKFTNETAA